MQETNIITIMRRQCKHHSSPSSSSSSLCRSSSSSSSSVLCAQQQQNDDDDVRSCYVPQEDNKNNKWKEKILEGKKCCVKVDVASSSSSSDKSGGCLYENVEVKGEIVETDVGRRGSMGGDGGCGGGVVTCGELEGLLNGVRGESKGMGMVVVVDVRSKLSYAWERVCGSLNYPYDEVFRSGKDYKGFQGLLEVVGEVVGRGGEVVVYDAGSLNVGDGWAKAGVVVRKLWEEGGFDEGVVRMLKGGFGQFNVESPECVVVDCGDKVKEMMRMKIGGKVSKWGDVVDSVGVAAGLPGKVLPYLMVGSARNAGSRKLIESLGVSHVLVVGEELKMYFPNDERLDYKQLFVKDLESENMEQEFKSVCEWLDGVREKSGQGAKVLIHCYAGVSRSVTCTVAYLIWLGYGLNEALALVKERRKGASPNDGFMKQLESWELTCLGL